MRIKQNNRAEIRMSKHRMLRTFEKRRSRIDYRIERDYVHNGVATIPCCISGYNDVISHYSAKGTEAMNPDFVDYLTSVADVTPQEYPLVLDIVGNCLSEEEKETIEDVILDDFAYDLGIVEKKVKRHNRNFILLLIGLAASGIALIVAGSVLSWAEFFSAVPTEFLYIIFWFTGETLLDYLFFSGYELRWELRSAGRLASIKVIFTDTYEKPKYSDSDVRKLYSEIEKETRKTIEEDEKD